MTPQSLKRGIAYSAYNIGYGARVHLATYDIVEKAPGWIGFLSATVGIFSLVYPFFGLPVISAALAVMGIGSLYVGFYTPDSTKYEKAGTERIKLQHQLRALYFQVEANTPPAELARMEAERARLEHESFQHRISKQIFLSEWYAHYKFFWQSQVDWIVEELNLSFWRDKMPFTATVAMSVLVVVAVALAGAHIVHHIWPCAVSP